MGCAGSKAEKLDGDSSILDVAGTAKQRKPGKSEQTLKQQVTAKEAFDENYQNFAEIKKLGEGSHGVAMLLQNPDTGEEIVRKEVKLQGLSEDEMQRTVIEIKALKALDHKHIVAYRDATMHENTLYIIMEYADGGNLEDAVKRHAKLSKPFRSLRVIRWLMQIADALEHVHSHRYLHRDLKSANVFLTKSADVKLGDFGISRALTTNTNMAKTLVGTPYFMAPEIVLGETYAHPADVWALGVIAFQLLTLQMPFKAPHLTGLLTKISDCEYDKTALEKAPHNETLRALVSGKNLLEPDPAKRMTLAQLMEMLVAERAKLESDSAGQNLQEAAPSEKRI
mmetsp:Transcript_27825/g.46289  ORF Transcript_27825/g.46289 Transcript_27825/m.46289 type:complete len:339 (-) Transcript_27825:254-1270(-)